MTARIDWSAERTQFESVQSDDLTPLEQNWNHGAVIGAAPFNEVRGALMEIDGEAAATTQAVERYLPLGTRTGQIKAWSRRARRNLY